MITAIVCGLIAAVLLIAASAADSRKRRTDRNPQEGQ